LTLYALLKKGARSEPLEGVLFGEMAEQQAKILEADAHRFIRDTEQVRELPGNLIESKLMLLAGGRRSASQTHPG
jgi:hypothetical protein